MGRDVLLVFDRDALWLLGLRAKLVHARSDRRAAAARRIARTALARAAERSAIFDGYGTAIPTRRAKVVSLARYRALAR
jgi:hypothetical protein